MLSRVADSLYWMSRYMERSDGILRMLKMNYASSQDDTHGFSWKPVLEIFTYMEDEEVDAIANQTRKVLQFMVTSRENPNSVFNIVTQARENARSVQDHIPKELWQCLNDFYHVMRNEHLSYSLLTQDPITVLDSLIRHCLLYYGTADITVGRGEGFSFMNIGKYLERGIQSSDILDVKFGDRNHQSDEEAVREDTTYWKYLLLSISGYQLYLKTYRSGFEAANVLEQIILNNEFPRSVSYSINRMHLYFKRLKSERNTESFNRIDFMMGKLASKVQYSTPESILQQGLHNYLQEIISQLNEIGRVLDEKYFAYL
jgi:uncharacterized alpha-E superfamily protein